MKTVNMAPNWKFAAAVYIGVLENPKASAKAVEAAKDDLMVMAGLADKYNELKKEVA